MRVQSAGKNIVVLGWLQYRGVGIGKPGKKIGRDDSVSSWGSGEDALECVLQRSNPGRDEARPYRLLRRWRGVACNARGPGAASSSPPC
jgi:hypothetical protein